MRSTPRGWIRSEVVLARVIELAGWIPFVGTALRWYAGRYSEGSVVTIRSGYARGMRWGRHHRYVNGYWLGQYELPVQAALVRELKPGAVFFDVGANAGFFTLLAARRIGPMGKCIAFDPDPENIASILEQCSLNGLSSVLVVNEAISDSVGRAWFTRVHPGAATGHLWNGKSVEEPIEVVTTTLDASAATYGAPDLIKIDVEGEEGRALRGGTNLLRERRPKWLVEIHSPDCEADVRSAFDPACYELCSLDGESLTGNGVLPKQVLVRPREPGPAVAMLRGH